VASSFLSVTYQWARRCVIAVVGGTVVLIGVLMIVFPGPAIVVIPAGLAILSLEFAWAKHWLRKVKATSNYMMSTASGYWTRHWRNSQSDGKSSQSGESAHSGESLKSAGKPGRPPYSQ